MPALLRARAEPPEDVGEGTSSSGQGRGTAGGEGGARRRRRKEKVSTNKQVLGGAGEQGLMSSLSPRSSREQACSLQSANTGFSCGGSGDRVWRGHDQGQAGADGEEGGQDLQGQVRSLSRRQAAHQQPIRQAHCRHSGEGRRKAM